MVEVSKQKQMLLHIFQRIMGYLYLLFQFERPFRAKHEIISS